MAAEWSVENTRIVSELFAEQVTAGNRPGNYLTPNAFDEVGKQFKMRTGLDYTYTQLKNKWDKLKGDFSLFKKLKFRETGAGWDYVNNTVSQDDGWWKKAKIVSSFDDLSHILIYPYHLFTNNVFHLLYYRTLKVVASSRRKDLLMKRTCGLSLEISQVMVLTIGIPLLAYLPPLVRQ
jgi:hypothetical protein